MMNRFKLKRFCQKDKSEMKVKRLRQTIILACEETVERIYLTSKNKRNTPERLVLKKYSPKLRRRAIFKEVK